MGSLKMEEIVLEVEPREGLRKSKVKDLRDRGFIPAVVYAAGKDAQPIKVSSRELLRLLHQHRLESVVINLKINPVSKKQKTCACLIKEIQYHPVTGNILHVDFNEISLTKVIKVNVPLVARGEPMGVKLEGGSLEHILWEIEIECLPTDIPKEIEVDVSKLNIGDSIHIKDITFPSNVKVLNDPEAIVLSVTAPIKEEIPVPPVEGEVVGEPEVIKEKKEVPTEGVADTEGKEKKEEKEKK